jgi:hypothetical protein
LYSAFEGQTECSAVYLQANSAAWGAIMGFFALLFFCGIANVESKFRAAVFAIMLFPAMDICSDIIYIISNPFISPVFFGLVVASFFLSNGSFIKKLYDDGAVPFTVRFYPGFRYGLVKNLWWLGQRSGYPTIDGELSSLVFDNNDDIMKLFSFIFLWLALIVMQFLTISTFALWMLVTSPLLLLLFIPGVICFQTKVIAVGIVYNTFMYYWTAGDFIRKSDDYKVDPALLNEAIFAEFMFETMPQCKEIMII